MKAIYEIGIYKRGKTIVLQAVEDKDSLNCEIVEYFGLRKVTKKHLKENKKTLLEEKYLKCYGNFCPFCGSDNITAGHGQFDANIAWRNVSCEDCNKDWIEEFVMTGVIFDTEDINK